MAFLPQNLSRTGSCLGGAEHTRSIKSNWLFLVQLVQVQKLVVQRTLRQPHPRPGLLARNIFMISMRANGLASCLAASFLNRNSNGDAWGGTCSAYCSTVPFDCESTMWREGHGGRSVPGETSRRALIRPTVTTQAQPSSASSSSSPDLWRPVICRLSCRGQFKRLSTFGKCKDYSSTIPAVHSFHMSLL